MNENKIKEKKFIYFLLLFVVVCHLINWKSNGKQSNTVHETSDRFSGDFLIHAKDVTKKKRFFSLLKGWGWESEEAKHETVMLNVCFFYM